MVEAGGHWSLEMIDIASVAGRWRVAMKHTMRHNCLPCLAAAGSEIGGIVVCKGSAALVVIGSQGRVVVVVRIAIDLGAVCRWG